MKYFKTFFYLFCISGLLSFVYMHPYHVGSWEIHYNPKSRCFEITGKFFSEDLEMVLESEYGKKIDLRNNAKQQENKILLKDYCSKHFAINCNSKKLVYDFLGFETNSESILIYLETPKTKTPKKIEINTDMLYKKIQEQIIFVHITINSRRHSQKIENPIGKVVKYF